MDGANRADHGGAGVIALAIGLTFLLTAVAGLVGSAWIAYRSHRLGFQDGVDATFLLSYKAGQFEHAVPEVEIMQLNFYNPRDANHVVTKTTPTRVPSSFTHNKEMLQ